MSTYKCTKYTLTGSLQHLTNKFITKKKWNTFSHVEKRGIHYRTIRSIWKSVSLFLQRQDITVLLEICLLYMVTINVQMFFF